MKITFVGTSHGIPQATRYCSCIMLESGGSIYFIDAGTSIFDALVRSGKQMKDVRAVFTTHTHDDHTVGLLHFASLMNWHFKDCSADFFMTEQNHIFSTKQWILTTGYCDVDESRLRFKLARDGVVYQDENIKVEYIRTRHSAHSYSILVTEGEKRVLFSGDLSMHLSANDLSPVIKENIDGFVCEMAHFGFDELGPYLDECGAKKVFFVHALESRYADIEQRKGKYPFEIFTPDDGDKFEI